MPKLHSINNQRINQSDYTAFVEKIKKETTAPFKGLIFIFPSDALRHHHGMATLFSRKSDTGLLQLAGELSALGYPTLSLPTQNMINKTKEKQFQMAQQALCALWYAAGAGYDFLLPVRAHRNQTFFTQAFQPTIGDPCIEPSFWGDTETVPNKPLADYYVEELSRLARFLDKSLSPNEVPRQFYRAYLASTPNTYRELFNKSKRKAILSDQGNSEEHATAEFLTAARALLQDYTMNNSCLLRFFSGHWNRHHIAAVQAIVQRIRPDDINEGPKLMAALLKINNGNRNPEGSLEKRIRFLEQMRPLTKAEKELETLERSFKQLDWSI